MEKTKPGKKIYQSCSYFTFFCPSPNLKQSIIDGKAKACATSSHLLAVSQRHLVSFVLGVMFPVFLYICNDYSFFHTLILDPPDFSPVIFFFSNRSCIKSLMFNQRTLTFDLKIRTYTKRQGIAHLAKSENMHI